MKRFYGLVVLLMSLSNVAWSAEGEGYELFSDRCGLCHRQAGPGTDMLERRLGTEMSILEERDNLTADYVKTVVRWGVGSMPRFTRGEVTDGELDLILEYLINAHKDSDRG